MIDLLIRNANIRAHSAPVDIAIEEGKILNCDNNLDLFTRQEINVEGCLVIPGFVDPHVHLDIILMNSGDLLGRQEPFENSNAIVEKRRMDFTGDDIKRRAKKALQMASRHGVTAVRAQCHVDTVVGLKHLHALQEVKEEYAGRVSVQIVAFPQQGLFRNPGTVDLFHAAFQAGADVMGGASNLDNRVEEHIDLALDLAMEHDVDLDIHADLGLAKDVNLDDLEVAYIAKKVIERGYEGRVTVGHACTLGSAPPEVAEPAIALMKEAQLNVVSQPDLYRLGRDDSHNVRRGLTKVKELLDAGVNVTYASNNIRDAFRPMGNFDPLEEALILSYGAHMDTVDQFNTLLRMSTYNGARALGLKNYGLEKGCDADLVVLNAQTPVEAIIGQVEKKFVLKSGRLMYATGDRGEIAYT